MIVIFLVFSMLIMIVILFVFLYKIRIDMLLPVHFCLYGYEHQHKRYQMFHIRNRLERYKFATITQPFVPQNTCTLYIWNKTKWGSISLTDYAPGNKHCRTIRTNRWTIFWPAIFSDNVPSSSHMCCTHTSKCIQHCVWCVCTMSEHV